MFNMKNKFKKIFEFLICLSAILCLMSCLNSVSSSGSSGKDNQPDESTTVIFKGSINIESSLTKSLLRSNNSLSNSRSASPEAIDMASHEFYVFATSKAGVTQEVEVQEDAVTGSVTFEVPLEFGEWTIEAGIRKTSDGQKILVDIFSVKLLTNTPTFSHAFYLKPVSKGMGSINLEMYVPDSITKMLITVHSQPEGADFDTTECTADGEAPDRKIFLTRTEVPAGTYNLVFTYYNSANNPQFSTIQTVNILAGLETSKWVSGSTSTLISGGFFAVTDDLIEAWRNQRSHYYVDSENGSDSNAGGPLDPYQTLSHAVSIINDIYGTETKEVKIDLADGFEETLVSAPGASGTLGISQNKTITIHANDNGTAKLHRGIGFYGEFISIPVSSTLTLEGLIIDGGGIAGDNNQGVHNAGTFIMNSGKICGNNNTEGEGGGVYNRGDFYLNGGEISGNVSNGSGAGIYLDGTDITIAGGIVKNNTLTNSTPSNLFLPSGKKIKVDEVISSGTDISIEFGWVPKKVTADTAIFTEGYGTDNSTKDPANIFKSDDKYYVVPLTSSSVVEAGIALSGKDFENVFKSYKMTFAIHDGFNKFMPSDPTAANRTIQIDPTVLFNTEDITETVSESIKWRLTLYYRGGLVGEEDSNVMVIPDGAGYTGRYDLHVYAEYLGLHKDAEFVITGYNNIIPVRTKEDLKTQFDSITNKTSSITRDTCINLVQDIDFSNELYYPISAKLGDDRILNTDTDFEGVFDGNGHTLKLGTVMSEDFVAICFRNKGTIQNLIIEKDQPITIREGQSDPINTNPETKGDKFHSFGGICHFNDGIIRNCWNKVSIKEGTEYGSVGGICCANYGVIENCIYSGNIESMHWFKDFAWGGRYEHAGGITGVNGANGTIRNCVNYGKVWMNVYYDTSSSMNGLVGAIAGCQEHGTSRIENCYWRYNCVRSDYSRDPVTSGSTERNWIVVVPQQYSINKVQAGTFVSNGTFPENNNGTLTASLPTINGQTQNLDHGNDLVTALNDYVNKVDPNHSYLREWESGVDRYGLAAVLKK